MVAPSAFAMSWPPRQCPSTGASWSMASRIRRSACRNDGSASFALISPPINASAPYPAIDTG